MIVNQGLIEAVLAKPDPTASQVEEILAKAAELQGLDIEDVQILASVQQSDLLEQLFETARRVKDRIYGKRLVLFAPLYVSNLCANECLYCAFRASNTEIRRKALSQDEIASEAGSLIEQGHKRILLVAGESYPREGFDYIIKAIDTIYKTKQGRGEIRRINVNIAPLEIEQFERLKAAGIGTYQLFQETYHKPTYRSMHQAGRKADYDWRLTAIDRAMQAGIDDVGIGVLFGLTNWHFELLALMQHINYLEREFGVGPHTISVPRIEPAVNSDVAAGPPAPVSDTDFKKLVAILRLAVPYTGIIMSTRETAAIRRETFSLGVSQISAGSRTNPGGYASQAQYEEQFSLGDHRPLDEVVRDIANLGYIPSFCTACYRLGRTGRDFMELAKPGEIKAHCDPNALTTFQEYLIDYASEETRRVGQKLIAQLVESFAVAPQAIVRKMLQRVCENQRDVMI